MSEIIKSIARSIQKSFSARFLISIGVSFAGCYLTLKVCEYYAATNKELVAFVAGQFFFIWKDIIKDYFNRPDRKEVQA